MYTKYWPGIGQYRFLIVLVIPVRLLANIVQVFVHALQHDLEVVEEVKNTARVKCDLCYLTWIGAFD